MTFAPLRFSTVAARLILPGLLALPVTGWAGKVAVLLPIIDSDGSVSEGKRNKFHDNLVSGLQGAATSDVQVISADELRSAVAGRSDWATCQSSPCAAQIAKATAADRVVVPKITVRSTAGGSSYVIELQTYDKLGVLLPLTGKETCGDASEGCNLTRAYDSMKRATASLAAQIGSQTLPERLTTGASASPASPPVAARETTASATASSPAPSLPKAEDAPASSGGASATEPSKYHSAFHYGWMVAAGVAGVSIISSIPFLYYASREDQITCGPDVQRRNCPTVYTGNLGPGVALLTIGLVSAGAMGALLYLDRREHKRMSAGRVSLILPTVAFSPEGVALAAGARF